MQQQFFNCLSKAHHNYANLDILSSLLLKFIQSEHPNAELDIDQSDVRRFLVKVA